MKLWIDDLRNPKSFVQGEWHWAKTITESIRILSTQPVEVVSIDHDIVLDTDSNDPHILISGKASPENYTAVAYYIVAMPKELRPKTVIVHSANFTGARTIANILDGHVDNLTVKMAMGSNSIE